MPKPTLPGRAVVTGASSGIGAEFARRLAQSGHDLVLVARRRDRLEDLALRLKDEYGTDAEILVADLSNRGDLSRVVARVAEDEALALLVNNAGFGAYRPFVSLDPAVADQLIDVNVRAVTQLTRAALPGMVRRGGGAIVNIASLLALSSSLPPNPMPNRATYAAAKAYVVAFTEALAGELTGTGVRVLVCLPGRVATEFFTVQGMDMAQMPPMMKPEDLVSGVLSGLAQGEVICVPALRDPSLIQRLSEAQVAIIKEAGQQPDLAARYQSAVAV